MLDSISQLLAHQYGIQGRVRRLAGENENYEITTPDGERFVLKLADDETRPEMIHMEAQAVRALAATCPDLGLPHVIPTKNGEFQSQYTPENVHPLRGRLLSFVEGTAWCEDLPKDKTVAKCRRQSLGEITARISLDLPDHPAGQRTHTWDLAAALQHWDQVAILPDPARQALVDDVFLRFEAVVTPRLTTLPRGIIHGDINDDNVLVAGDQVCGILDFGDCLDNPLVCDLAIALAYHTLDEDAPLEAAAEIIAAYHRVRPLSPAELTVLFPMVCARLAVSVIISQQRRRIDPDRASWFVSEARAWAKLETFSKYSPRQAATILASGLEPKILAQAFPHPGRPVEELLEARRKNVAPSLSLAYDAPLKFVSGQGAFLFNPEGRPFLDLYNNVCHVGHCRPEVVRAGQDQMAKLNTNTRYLYDGLTDYAQALVETLPPELDTCFFVNSGTEANELALRLARAWTEKTDFLVVDGAYHGHSQTMVQISPYKFMGKGGTGRPEPWVHVVPLADPYRGPHRGMGADAGKAYGDELLPIIETCEDRLAGFITEGLLSCGGQVIPPDNYFATAFAHVRQAGGLCIVDEVQTGFGRTGNALWAFERQGVVPDIVVLGKPMGNGHPMGAVVCRRDIAEKFANGMEFFATFGGNPVSCAMGQAVLEVIRKDQLQAHALAVGNALLEGLTQLKERHGLIGDVRGTGLFAGIELVLDRNTREPAPEQAKALVNRLRHRGILTGTDGPFNNVVKLKPPMVVSRDDMGFFLRALDQELAQLNS